MAKITIKSEPQSRSGTSNKGKPYSVVWQNATLETENLKVPVEVELQHPDKPYQVGGVFEWEPESDLRVGRFGIELSRYMTLTPAQPGKRANA
jgi:hypothetical protein